MDTAIYIIWFLIPTVYFLLALWAKLEQMSGSVKKHDPLNLFKLGVFLMGCVLVSVVIDVYLLEQIVNATVGDLVPLSLFRILLLPLVLNIGARIVGPSQRILIGSPNRAKPPTQNRGC